MDADTGEEIQNILCDDEATEHLLMQLVAFTVSLKSYLRDEQVQRDEVGVRMDWNHVRVLNKSVHPPITALKILSETVRTSLPKETKASSLASAIFDETSEQIRVVDDADLL